MGGGAGGSAGGSDDSGSAGGSDGSNRSNVCPSMVVRERVSNRDDACGGRRTRKGLSVTRSRTATPLLAAARRST